MQPRIDRTEFGAITIAGEVFTHDVLIRLDGRVEKRKKKLSKAVFGTGHRISLDEAKQVYEQGAKGLIIGSGEQGQMELSAEAAAYFQKKACRVTLLPTPQAVGAWNQARGARIGLFHVTC